MPRGMFETRLIADAESRLMLFNDPADQPGPLEPNQGPWYRELNRYHWFVLLVASLGWMFDTMDQQLFNLARVPAMRELLRPKAAAKATSVTSAAAASVAVEVSKEDVGWYAGVATAIFLIGWALGGLAFGVLGDRIGRAKTMLITILIYSLFTGLSALSSGFWDFAFYRFLTGLGVGGEFAVGVSLVAEVMPDRARPFALGLLQAFSAVGNMVAALVGIVLAYVIRAGYLESSWRVMFVVGALPALLCILIRSRLKEPERWKAVAAKASEDPGETQRLGSINEMFTDSRWRRNAIVGMLLAFAGVVGLWGIGFFSFDLINSIFRKRYQSLGLSARETEFWVSFWVAVTSLIQNAGAFFGVNAFSYMTHRLGRKPAFFVTFLLAMVSTAFTFWFLNSFWDIFWMIPIMGFCQVALFGGYAIYFPELFPTRLRSTGTSFCYNVGRLVAAAGPLTLGALTGVVFRGYPEPMRYAGVSMSLVFIIGIMALPFAPETKGRPLPE
jgi:MFS family permease